VQPYDPNRENERLETRLHREMDRRFGEMAEQLKDLRQAVESLEKKIDANTEKLENRQYEKQTWTMRQIVMFIASFVLGGGALGVVQLIIELLRKP
jgi:phage host-nuclease inhibitor protein Gam